MIHSQEEPIISCLPFPVEYVSLNIYHISLLQDQCAWALGNLAGDSAECRSLLHAQGAVDPLVKLLQVYTDMLTIILCESVLAIKHYFYTAIDNK